MTPPTRTGSPEWREKAQLMSASEIERTLVRLAHELVEKNADVANLGLVGIRRRGAPLAERLARLIQRIERTRVPVGTLDITYYRDELSTVGAKPVVQKTPMEFEVGGMDIVLVDGACNSACSSIAAIANCPSKPPSSGARSRPPTMRSSRSRNLPRTNRGTSLR
jgi:pyrimidine operon attenuation protein/uracil phosphoribosyltransferase